MKQNKTLIKELRQELHYHQMMNRVDLRAYRAGVRKCKEIAAKMRALQNGEQPNTGMHTDAAMSAAIEDMLANGELEEVGRIGAE